MDPDTEIEVDLSPMLILYKSGRVERFKGTDVVPPTSHPSAAVISKDVAIDPITAVSARLYLPSAAPKSQKLPILVYFHGGGFCIESAFSPTYQNFLNTLVAKSQILAVSIGYRLAPEHPIPIPYDDSWTALQWIAARSDPWIEDYGDLDRVFLAGDSAGANIAHHMALRAGGSDRFRIEGVALIHPYFWGADPIPGETTDPGTRLFIAALWRAAGGGGPEDPRLDPLAEAAPGLEGLACRRVMVCVAELDSLRQRGRAYYEHLSECGWGGEAEFVESEGEGHVFHLFMPDSDKALALMERVVAFLNQPK